MTELLSVIAFKKHLAKQLMGDTYELYADLYEEWKAMPTLDYLIYLLTYLCTLSSTLYPSPRPPTLTPPELTKLPIYILYILLHILVIVFIEWNAVLWIINRWGRLSFGYWLIEVGGWMMDWLVLWINIVIMWFNWRKDLLLSHWNRLKWQEIVVFDRFCELYTKVF